MLSRTLLSSEKSMNQKQREYMIEQMRDIVKSAIAKVKVSHTTGFEMPSDDKFKLAEAALAAVGLKCRQVYGLSHSSESPVRLTEKGKQLTEQLQAVLKKHECTIMLGGDADALKALDTFTNTINTLIGE